MTQVCINRPNRTRPRYFRKCDVARIAEQCVVDTQTRHEEVLACVAMRLGFSHISLSRGIVESKVTLSKGAIQAIRTALASLARTVKTVLKDYPNIVKWIGALEEAVQILDDLLDDVQAPEQGKVEDFAGENSDCCRIPKKG